MMASRDLDDLKPPIKAKALELKSLFEQAYPGSKLLIYCTNRTLEEQARLYRQGRGLWRIKLKAKRLTEKYMRPGLAAILIGVGPQKGSRKVTWAGPGQSMHNYGLAFDCVPVVDGDLVWDHKDPVNKAMWDKLGSLGRSVGLEWGGDWRKKKDRPHFQQAGIDYKSLI